MSLRMIFFHSKQGSVGFPYYYYALIDGIFKRDVDLTTNLNSIHHRIVNAFDEIYIIRFATP